MKSKKLTEGQIDMAINSKIICLVKFDMNNNNISEDVAFKNVKETLLYQLLKNKKTDLFLKPKEYIEEAYRLEKTQSKDAMMEFITNLY